MKKPYQLTPAQHAEICAALRAHALSMSIQFRNCRGAHDPTAAHHAALSLVRTVHTLTALNQIWQKDLDAYDKAIAFLGDTIIDKDA